MRILLIHQQFLELNDGGGSRWNEMSRMWALDGHEVTILAGMVHYTTGVKSERYKGKYVFVDRYPEGNIKVIRSHVSESYNTSFIGRLWGYFSFVFSSLYAGIFFAREKFDIIIVTSPPLFVGITAYVLSKLKRVPFVFEVRDLWPESAIDTGVVKSKVVIKMAYWFESFIYKKAGLINVLTPAFRDALIKKAVPVKKIILIPNAADFELVNKVSKDFDPIAFRIDHSISKDAFVITYVGAHGVANHLIQLIDVAEKLIDTNVQFLLIGEGMEKKILKEEVDKRNLQNIKFIDAVPKKEVFKYILASDLGVSALKKVETFKTVFSNKTFDYMACKKPILMLIDGVSRELVEKANCGMYAEPENINEIVSKVKFYLENKYILNKQGLNGYLYAKDNFDRSVLSNKYLNELIQMVELNG